MKIIIPAPKKYFFYAGLNSSWAAPMPTLTTEAGFVDLFCANVDGKYEDEVIKVNNVVSGNNDQLTFKVYTPNLFYGLAPKYTRTFNFSTLLQDETGYKSIHPKYYYTGDFNGDGKMEILAVSCHNPFGWADKISKCYLFDLDANTILYEGSGFEYNVEFIGSRQNDGEAAHQNTDRLYAFDYDGDGKTDICLINDAGTYIYTFDISGSVYSMRQVAHYAGLKKSDLADRELMLGEFNGDGKPDFLLSPKVNASDWNVFYSMGNGQFEKKAVSITTRNSNPNFLVQDINGDGISDVIKYDNSGFYTYLTNRNGFPLDCYSSSNYNGSLIVPISINSRYSLNQLTALKDGKVTCFSYSKNDIKNKLLTGMVNSLGVVDKNYYHMLSKTSYYTEGYGADPGYENFNGSLHVPVCTEQYFNGQLKEKNTYSYENAVIHKQGLGFRGFEKITTYDYIRGRTMIQEYNPLNFSTLKSEETPWVKNTNEYSVNVASNKIVRITLNSRSSYDKLKNQTTSHSYLYDLYGNPISESINYGGGITGTVSRAFYNNPNEFGYLIGFPIDISKTTNRNGSNWNERVMISSHNNGLPLVQKQLHNGLQVAHEEFVYDASGNITRKRTKNYTSSTDLDMLYEYDNYGRMKKETDPMGFITTWEYNTNGSLKNHKNHNGQATSYGYDSFGRVTSVSFPEGTVKSTNYSWTGAGTNGLYCITTTSGGPTSKVYYDALNRETRSSEMRFNGVEGSVDKLYDSYGRLQKVSLPFTGATASLWTESGYDNYDRLSYINEASGKRTTYSYSGSSVTTTKEGVTSTQTFDTHGNLILVSDPAGIITYNLRPDGQPNTIVAPGNVTTSFNYDVYGRRSNISDPSAGTQSWDYDAAGNTIYEMDANGKVIYMTYDSYNRLINKSSPEFSTAYNYNTDGLISSITSTNGTSTVYTYDTYGRVNKIVENSVDNKWLQKIYNYNSDGNIQSIGYMSQTGNITTENYYYSHGSLSEIKLNGTTSIWKLISENTLGQPTSVTTGSVNRSYEYSPYGLPTSRTAGSFQNFSYNFDVMKGNLTYRRDNYYGIQENFNYDHLNRLTEYHNAGAGYDIKGNLTGKTDLGGSLYYNTSGKPYAISGVNSVYGAIPLRNQNITYTSFRRPNTIAEGLYTASFVYNSTGDRVKMELKKNGASELRRYYLADQYELDEGVAGTKEKLYLGGDYYSAAAVYVKEGTGSWQIYYICRDYLGSITHITNSSGSVVQQLSYDAWGRLRTPSNFDVYLVDSEPVLFLGRGYTGHEHLTMFGLINMNARLYDPAIGRFLAADPFVQAPHLSQSFNRYSYAMNNPLRYTDPDGEFWHIVVGAVIGGAANLLYKACTGQINSWGDGFAAFGIGAAAGALGAATGGLAFAAAGGAAGGIGGFIAGAAGGAASSMIMMPIQNIGNNLYFGDPLMSAKDYAMGIGIGALAGGFVNGGIAAIKGNNFFTGKAPTQNSSFSASNAPVKQAPEMKEIPGKHPKVDVPERFKSTPEIVNSKGVPYPKVTVDGYGEIPFPEGPFTPNNSSSLRLEFTKQLKSDYQKWWTNQGRPWPVAPEGSVINIHHIKPLQFGGTNNFQNLVPLIQPGQHQPFTSWWVGFRINF